MLRQFPKVVLVLFALLTVVPAQSISRDNIAREYKELRSRLREMEKTILRPSEADVRAAEEKGVKAIRLMPREKSEDSLTISGGGAYYSFARLAHDYGNGSQIELQQNELSVGFAGADYGFLYDLGDVDLSDVEKETGPVRFLATYEPPSEEPKIRAEQRMSRAYEADGFVYKRSVPALVGHTYALRSINFAESDLLVALRIVRKDSDGSLIILWRTLATFRKPEIAWNLEVRAL